MVQRPLDGMSGQLLAPQVTGDGLDQLDPQIPLTPYVQAAFAVGAPIVNIRGVLASCRFQLVGDYVDFVKLDGQPPGARRVQVYEFREWL
jgi:hypothetical protein